MKSKTQFKKSQRDYNMKEPYQQKRGQDYVEDEYQIDSESEVSQEDNLSNLDEEDEYIYNEAEAPGNQMLGGISLADVILQKLKEKEIMNSDGSNTSDFNSSLSPKIIEVYTSIGDLLSKYRSGKLPKAVKVLPHLKRWEEILSLTNPANWSAAGTFAITKIFASNLNAKLVQRYYTLVLLEKCRADIEEHRKLNFHLYHALKKALFKPAAFYKGIVLPLLQADCSQLEAIIFSSVLSKASIPAIHSAAVLLKIMEFPPTTASIVFIKQLLLKKYAFPARVVSEVCRYFDRSAASQSHFPVIWHQALLLFTQRYKNQLNEDERESIIRLIQAYPHHEISPEIRRELTMS